MTECPDLAALEGGARPRDVERHVASCPSCQFVVELIDDRTDSADECSRFETLLAARADGSLGRAAARLLTRHLATCVDCRAVADTLAPTADAAGDHVALPQVDPAIYELGLEVARGGMGRILAARDLRVGRPVALKELLGRSPALAARFEREARVTARLQHPGIVPIYEIGRWPDGTPFYSMRMVDGRTLRQAIDGAQTLPERLALLPAVIAATEAVAFAHGQRIIHRDLTPSNVLMGAYGETVVIDWGLAKDLTTSVDPAAAATSAGERDGDDGDDDAGADPSSRRLTGLGAVIGTAAYMPPEQAHAVPVDERADVYALGAILYHVLAGQPPYRASGTAALLAAVRGGPPPPILDRAPRAPPDLRSIVTKAMARDQAARYPTARELSDELKRFHTGRLVEAHAYTTRQRVRRFVARNRAALVVLAAAAIILGGGAWLSIQRVIDSQAHAERTARTLLEERGRTEALAGHPLKALAYLGVAYSADRAAPGRDFLLTGVLRELDDLEATLDCGADVIRTALSPDGTQLAAACGDLGRIWNLADHRVLFTLGPAPDGFYWLSYARDGGTLVFGGMDGVARLYDPHTGALRLSLEHRAGTEINRASFNPTATRLITTGADGKAVVWDAATGARLHVLAAGSFGFLGVYGELSPDGKTLLTATMGGVGTGWDIETGAELGSLDHGGQILGADMTSDGTLAATCGVDRRTVVWDLDRRALRLTLSGHSDVIWKCVFAPDGRRLLTTSADGTAKIWDLATGTLVTAVDAGDIVHEGEFSADGRLIVTNTLDGAAQVWDAETGALLTSHTFAGRRSHFTTDGGRLVMERVDGKIQLWRHPTGRQRHQLAPPAGATLVELHRDGSRAIMERRPFLEVWDVVAGRPVTHAAVSEPFAFASHAHRLAAHTTAGVAVIDLDSGATVATIAATEVVTVALDRDGARVLVGDGTAPPRVIDVASGRVLVTLTGATDAILADDGRRALAWRAGTSPVVWSVDGERPPLVLTTVAAGFAPVGFSADGRRLALHVDAEPGRGLIVLDTTTAEQVVAVRVAADASRFDPGGTLLTAIAADGVIRILRVDDGTPVAAFVGERLTSAQADRTGTLVVATDRRDGAVSILDARDGRMLVQWPIVHAPGITTEDRFTLSRSAAWWTPDGDAVVARGSAATVWDAATLPPGSSARIARALRSVPWRIVDGQLRWVHASLSGRVTRAGQPVAGVRVAVSFRELPRSPTQVSWTVISTRPREVATTTDRSGAYQIRNLPAGDFSLVAHSDSLGCGSESVARTMAELDQQIDLDLTACDR